MMAQLLNRLALMFAVAVFPACAPLYTPNAMHTALPNRAGTVDVGACYGAGSLNVTAAAPVDNICLFGSLSIDNGWFIPEGDSGDQHYSHRFIECGLGGSFLADSTRFDILAGYGSGHAVAYWPNDSDIVAGIFKDFSGVFRLEGDYHRAFIQINASNTRKPSGTREPFDVVTEGLVLRTSYVWFDNVTREARSTTHPRALFLDPVAFIRAGSGSIQVDAQAGLSIKVPLNQDQLRWQLFFLELGVHVVLTDLW